MLRVPVVASVVFSAALAATAPAGATETLIVTASRTPVPADQIGSSVSVFTQEDLTRRQLSSLAEILRDVPGIAVSRSGVLGAATQIRVRGAEANQVMVFIDGVEANDLTQGSEFDFAHLLTGDLDRIEVIRGPQSALWGSDALAGVINVTTRRGEGPAAVTAFLEGGSFASVHGGGSVSGSNDTAHFALNGSWLSAGGTNISRAGDEDDGYENGTVGLSLGYAPRENLAFDFTGRHTSARNEFDATDFAIGLPADSDDESKVTRNYARLHSRLALNDGRWEHQAAVAVTDTGNTNFAAGVETGGNDGVKTKFDYQTSILFTTADRIRAAHTLTLAVEHEREDFEQRGPASFFGDPNQDQDVTMTGLVAEYRVTLADRFSLTGGIRHDDNSDFRNATTYRLSASHQFPGQGPRLRASYGTGVKNPTFTERFGYYATSLTPFLGNADLQPERSRGWELGLDQSAFGDRLHAGVTYFNERLHDEIDGFAFDAAALAFTARNLDGVSRREGVELTGDLALADGLTLAINYAYVDATEPDATGARIRELRRPKHVIGGNFNWSFLAQRADLNLNVHHNGVQRDIFYPAFPAPSQIVTLDDFTVVNVTGSYQLTPHLTMYGRVENAFDDDYEELYGYRAPGAGVYVGLRATLNP